MTPEELVTGGLILGFSFGAGYLAFRPDSPGPVRKGLRSAVPWILLGLALAVGVAALLVLGALRDLGRAMS
jgi:multisubunit Na+/H+ antiporter MnhB subunit